MAQDDLVLCALLKDTPSPRRMSLLGVPRTTSYFCSSPPEPSLTTPSWLHTTESRPATDAPRWRCGLSGRVAVDAPTTGYDPNLVKDSQTCIDVSSEYTPINIAVHRENFNNEDVGNFTVREDSDIVTPRAVSSQRSAASTVPALMNLDSMS